MFVQKKIFKKKEKEVSDKVKGKMAKYGGSETKFFKLRAYPMRLYNIF